jgi:hypothetical protein
VPAAAKMEGLDFRCTILCAGAEKSHTQVTFYGTRVPKNVKSAQEIANPRPRNVKKPAVGRGPTLRPRSGGSGGETRGSYEYPREGFRRTFSAKCPSVLPSCAQRPGARWCSCWPPSGGRSGTSIERRNARAPPAPAVSSARARWSSPALRPMSRSSWRPSRPAASSRLRRGR